PHPPRCGQGKTDTQLSHPSTFFIFIGTDIPEIRVLPSAVVAHLAGSDHSVSPCLPRGVRAVRRPLACYTAQASLGHGIVATLALTTHATGDSMGSQHGLIRVAGR